MEKIKLKGVTLHNIKELDLTIPKQKLIVITGVSGSGKSSLAFDVLFEEGKNQYLRLLGLLSGLEQESHFEKLEGIGPAIAIKQSIIRQSNRRSTVGSKTKLLNSLALVFASDGEYEEKGKYYDVDMEQLVTDRHMRLSALYEKLKVTAGFMRLLKKKLGSYFDLPFWELPEEVREEVIYGRFENGKQSYCIERILKNAMEKGEEVDEAYKEIICPECEGERVSEAASKVTLGGKRIGELGKMTLTELLDFMTDLRGEKLSRFSQKIIKEITTELHELIHFRLGHLSLYRGLPTLSGGELQRLFLHLHLESALESLIYVFDEPMAGLHPSEKLEMIKAVKRLKDLGNTVIVVTHDQEMIKEAEHIIEIGPQAGSAGGKIVYQGDYSGYLKADTLLSSYLVGKTPLFQREKKIRKIKEELIIEHAKVHYLKDLTVSIPLHQLVGIAGLSGSGKSSLIEDTLLKRLTSYKKYGSVKGLKGAEKIKAVIKVSQEPIGRNASSTPASYIGIWDKIRQLFAKTDEARKQGFDAGYFSFHSKGACQACGGSGYEKIFLSSDFSVNKVCPSCKGRRYTQESLLVSYKEKVITEVLDMSVSEAVSFFKEEPALAKPLVILEQMGMGYLKLGQPTASLSGGEAQRLKLAKALGKHREAGSLYVLDEPTNGLSLYDVDLLLKLLSGLVESGNSVVVIEHHTGVLKSCDHIIELGPEGGRLGGQLIAEGPPEMLYHNPQSKTGRYLI